MGRIVRSLSGCLLIIAAAAPAGLSAGNQIYEPLAASVQATLHKAISDHSVPLDRPLTFLGFASEADAREEDDHQRPTDHEDPATMGPRDDELDR